MNDAVNTLPTPEDIHHENYSAAIRALYVSRQFDLPSSVEVSKYYSGDQVFASFRNGFGKVTDVKVSTMRDYVNGEMKFLRVYSERNTEITIPAFLAADSIMSEDDYFRVVFRDRAKASQKHNVTLNAYGLFDLDATLGLWNPEDTNEDMQLAFRNGFGDFAYISRQFLQVARAEDRQGNLTLREQGITINREALNVARKVVLPEGVLARIEEESRPQPPSFL